MDLSPAQRQRIADEIVRRIDTVTLLSCEEVAGLWDLAQAGEFDDQQSLILGETKGQVQ